MTRVQAKCSYTRECVSRVDARRHSRWSETRAARQTLYGAVRREKWRQIEICPIKRDPPADTDKICTAAWRLFGAFRERIMKMCVYIRICMLTGATLKRPVQNVFHHALERPLDVQTIVVIPTGVCH